MSHRVCTLGIGVDQAVHPPNKGNVTGTSEFHDRPGELSDPRPRSIARPPEVPYAQGARKGMCVGRHEDCVRCEGTEDPRGVVAKPRSDVRRVYRTYRAYVGIRETRGRILACDTAAANEQNCKRGERPPVSSCDLPGQGRVSEWVESTQRAARQVVRRPRLHAMTASIQSYARSGTGFIRVL